MTEREAQIFSITAENSSRKIKNELAKHNGWHTYPEDPEPVIKTPYALCHEEKRIKKKKCLSQRDGMREFLKTTNKRKPIQGREEKERKKEKKSWKYFLDIQFSARLQLVRWQGWILT